MKSRVNEKKVFGIIMLVITAIGLLSLLVMSLWNAVLVPVLHISAVSFWQAAGILLLSKILFSGFKGGGPFGGRRYQWRQELKDKWQHLSPDERENMKQEWKQRCSRWGSWQNKPVSEAEDLKKE